MSEVTSPEQPSRAGDPWLPLVTVALLGFGLVMVLSSSSALAYTENLSPFYYFERQTFFAVLGLVALVVASRLDYHLWRRWATPAAAVVLFLMLVVLVPGVGREVNGARRWFSVGPLGTFQPSEVAKLVLAAYLAQWVEKRGERIQDLKEGLLAFSALMAVVLGVIVLQKDLGTALVTGSIFLAVYFTGGAKFKHLALLVACLAAAFLLLVVFASYRSARLSVFLNPFHDPMGNGYQISQALVGLGSGGLTGVGLGHSIQKYLWLPEAQTDFIFAIVGEETGLIGATAMLGGFVFLAYRGYLAAYRAPDRYGLMLGAGITSWIALQALLNMGTVTDTLPVTGVTLPLISYGGSSLAITLVAIGVLINISRQGGRSRRARRRTDAAVDSGRWDGRPSAPSPRRRPSLSR